MRNLLLFKFYGIASILVKRVEVLLVLLGVLLAIFTSVRPESVGSDTAMYVAFFDSLNIGSPLEEYFTRFEPGFLLSSEIVVFLGGGARSAFFIVFLFVFLGISTGFFKKSELFGSPLWLALFFLSYPFFYSLTLNIIRQGIAFVFIVYAIDRRIYGAYIEAICWLAVAFLFHYASLFYLLAGLLIEFRIRLWFMLFIWVALSTLIMITGSAYVIDTASWFLNLTGWFPQYRTYVDAVGALEYETGFKLHWFLFSAIPILIVAIAYKCGARLSTEGRYVLNLYIAILIIHVFLFGFAYSDRVAIMAWILWPYIINPSAFTSGFIRKAQNWYVILMTKVILLVIAMAMFIFHLGLI